MTQASRLGDRVPLLRCERQNLNIVCVLKSVQFF